MPLWEVIAHGRVQGVGYRWFVFHCANRFGLNGYVRNLRDGTVQIVVDTEPQLLHQFCLEIRNGSHYATVTDLDIVPLVSGKEYNDFTIK